VGSFVEQSGPRRSMPGQSPRGGRWCGFGPPQPLLGLRTLLDDLVSGGQQRLRDSKAECLGRLEVDAQLVFCRELNGKFRWLLAA
jgi:hypothetical protein